METLKSIGDWLRRQGRKINVVLRAAPTWLTAAGAAVAYFHENIVGLLPPAWQGDATDLAVSLAGAIAAATAIIRRVTPVDTAERGVLPVPQDPPLPPGV